MTDRSIEGTKVHSVSRKDIKVYLHNMVRDECESEFMYYMADNQVYEHKINQHDRLQAFGASNCPRRDPSKNPLLQPPSVRKKGKKIKTMGGRKPEKGKKVMKQAGGNKSKEESRETDDLMQSHKEREPTEYNNPAKQMGSDHPVGERNTNIHRGRTKTHQAFQSEL